MRDEARSRSVLIVAGETSGEQHAAGLVRETAALNPGLAIRWFGSGGRHMAEAGVELFEDVSRLGAIGPWDALGQLRVYLKLFSRLTRQAAARRPDLAVLVDFPDFNLRLARRLKALGIPVCYFISPQVWAWRRARVRQVASCVDLMLVILPFEVDFYAAHGVKARYVGNPTAASLRSTARQPRGAAGHSRPLIALMPGSRGQEVARLFPLILDSAQYIAERVPVDFQVIKAPAVRREQLESIYRNWTTRHARRLPLEIREERSVALLAETDCAIIKSGTSTLEAMVLGVPFAMVYRMARPSWYLARPFATTEVYCLANLVAGKRVVPEFVQDQATAENIGGFMVRLLENEPERARMREELRQALSTLGELDAYQEAAKSVSKLLLEGLTV
jgi:lipid-A-disaccharide synthase